MPRYMSLIKYSTGAMASVRSEGYGVRAEAARTAIESAGGTLEEMSFVSGGQWDIVVIMDLPSSAAMFDMTHATAATGAFERQETLELFSAEEADGAQAATMEWTAPGQ